MCESHPSRPRHEDYNCCKECVDRRQAYNRGYSARPEKRANTQRWKDANRQRLREYNLVRLYKITLAEYDALLAAQGGVCAICEGPPAVRDNFHVDHEHATGVVRGLLCHHCNIAIGGLKDSPELLEKAAAYLRSKKA